MADRVICIDSCVIISYLKGGTDRKPADLPDLNGLFADIHTGKIHVLFPTLLRIEMLQCNLTKPLIDKFDALTGLPNFDEIPLNSNISKIAAEIRNFYVSAHRADTSIHKLALADSVFIATAIHESCPQLYTYDGDREPPSKPRKLLSLKTPIAGQYSLSIQKPMAFQLGIP